MPYSTIFLYAISKREIFKKLEDFSSVETAIQNVNEFELNKLASIFTN